MSALAAEGLDAARLALLARRLARVDSALETAADAAAGLMVGPGDASGAMRIAAADFARLPAEVALRLLRRAIARMGDEGPVELGKLEALVDALALAGNAKDQRFRRTLAGAVVTLAAGKLTIERAPPRRARRSETPAAPRSAPGRAKGPFTKSP
jgi:tRNA(Ile)-lysidine synthase